MEPREGFKVLRPDGGMQRLNYAPDRCFVVLYRLVHLRLAMTLGSTGGASFKDYWIWRYDETRWIVSAGGGDPGLFAGAMSVDDLRAMLKPYDAGPMKAYEVSRAVNGMKNDSPEFIEPFAK